MAEAAAQELSVTILDLVEPENMDVLVELPEGPVEVDTVSTEEFKQVPIYLHSSGTSGEAGLTL